MKHLKKFNEDQYTPNESEELANKMGIGGFEIHGVEDTIDGFKLIGYRNGELGYVTITANGCQSGDIDIIYSRELDGYEQD